MNLVQDALIWLYPWTKAIHIMAVISWMAGLFYLPRLFAYHAERGRTGSELSETLKIMEQKLLRIIMNPAMIVTWIFGISLLLTPGIIDWGSAWIWIKLGLVSAMTWFHHMLGRWRKDFAEDRNVREGRFYRLWNEAPTLLMVLIVIMVVVRPF